MIDARPILSHPFLVTFLSFDKGNHSSFSYIVSRRVTQHGNPMETLNDKVVEITLRDAAITVEKMNEHL